jgi:hypothetical protein
VNRAESRNGGHRERLGLTLDGGHPIAPANRRSALLGPSEGLVLSTTAARSAAASSTAAARCSASSRASRCSASVEVLGQHGQVLDGCPPCRGVDGVRLASLRRARAFGTRARPLALAPFAERFKLVVKFLQIPVAYGRPCTWACRTRGTANRAGWFVRDQNRLARRGTARSGRCRRKPSLRRAYHTPRTGGVLPRPIRLHSVGVRRGRSPHPIRFGLA